MPTTAQELPLAERRAVAAFQQDRLPALVAEINKAAGKEVPVEIQWNEIVTVGAAPRIADDGFMVDVYFRPLIQALSEITSDQMGRDALKAKLTRIVLRHDPATAPASNYPNGLTFADGTLTINFRPDTNAADVKDRAEAIRKALEAKL